VKTVHPLYVTSAMSSMDFNRIPSNQSNDDEFVGIPHTNQPANDEATDTSLAHQDHHGTICLKRF
jgi:hypothetical protein